MLLLWIGSAFRAIGAMCVGQSRPLGIRLTKGQQYWALMCYLLPVWKSTWTIFAITFDLRRHLWRQGNVTIIEREIHVFPLDHFLLGVAVLSMTKHYPDVIMSTMASQITSLVIVYSTVYSDADQTKHQSSASLAFVWVIPRTNGQQRGKCFHLMTSSWVFYLLPTSYWKFINSTNFMFY